MGFDEWLKTVCFQKPTPEAYDLAKEAWSASIKNLEQPDSFGSFVTKVARSLGSFRFSELSRVVRSKFSLPDTMTVDHRIRYHLMKISNIERVSHGHYEIINNLDV